MPVSPKKKLKNGRAEYYMLEEAFILMYWCHQQRQPLLLTTNAEVSVLSLHTSCALIHRVKNTKPHEINKITSAPDQGHSDVSYPIPAPSPESQVFHSHPSYLCCWFKISNSADVPCKLYKFGFLKCIFFWRCSQTPATPSVGFKLTFAAGRRPRTYTLDRAATGTVMNCSYENKILC